MKLYIAAVWLVLASPLVAFVVYEWATHPHHHPDQGPHGGALVEWDFRHDSLAELVPNPESGSFDVYVLDRWARRPRPVKAVLLHLNLTSPLEAKYEFASAPQDDDPPGRSSRFTASSAGPVGVHEFTGTLGGHVDGRLLLGSVIPANPRQ